MASMLCRTVSQISRRAVFASSLRSMSGGGLQIDNMKGKVADDKADMPDLVGHAVGPERWELLKKMEGEDDPFEMKVKQRAKGTRDEPTMVPSTCENRLVGCICEEDAISISWMYLHRGEPKRCQCGYWFKLVDLPH